MPDATSEAPVVWFEDVRREDVAKAGGKNASPRKSSQAIITIALKLKKASMINGRVVRTEKSSITSIFTKKQGVRWLLPVSLENAALGV